MTVLAKTIRILSVALFLVSGCRAQDPGELNIVSVQRVFHNGEHNAFTDLVRFKGAFYLTFRSCPDGHMLFPSSSIIVLKSRDAEEWEQVHQFSVPNRDVRDPHFLVFHDKLFVYTRTWYCESAQPSSQQRNLNQHLGYGVWSEDGRRWSGPHMLEGTYGHYIWRAAVWKNRAYLCGRRKHQFVEMPRNEESRRLTESAMLVSEDGLVFRTVGLFQQQYGDETAFCFEKNGQVLAIARRGRGAAEICRSQPPFVRWERKDLDRYIGGPLLVKWNDRFLVGGRKLADDGVGTTVFYWLEKDALRQCLSLPSAGDNSYPGFVALSHRRALISYYSSHEQGPAGDPITAIYLATVETKE